MFVCFKQKTAYDMRISDWSSDVCSSDLLTWVRSCRGCDGRAQNSPLPMLGISRRQHRSLLQRCEELSNLENVANRSNFPESRSEEHTSELQSLMRISYAVFCLKKKTTKHTLYILKVL